MSEWDDTRERVLPNGWLEAMDSLSPEERSRLAYHLSQFPVEQETARRLLRLMHMRAPERWLDETREHDLPTGWLAAMDSLGTTERSALARFLSEFHSVDARTAAQALGALFPGVLEVRPEEGGAYSIRRAENSDPPYFPEKQAELLPAERAEVASDAASAVDRALAMLFIRLGPPPEASATEYAPASNGGGGAQQ